MRKIRHIGASSLLLGDLPIGCKLCRGGKKLVLFITGLCNQSCYYCPVSFQRRNKDIMYANERLIRSLDEAVNEAYKMGAYGAGITGGNPILKIKRTIRFIKGFKEKFGHDFHFHLYAPIDSLNRKIMENLFSAGLDELRIHITNYDSISTEVICNKLSLFENFKSYSVGIELPCIPKTDKKLKKIIEVGEEVEIKFLILNELEISESNYLSLKMRNYNPRSPHTSSVIGSYETALRVLKWAESKGLSIHYCSSESKNRFQLTNRLIRRAKRVAKNHELVTREGLIKKLVIHPTEAGLNRVLSELEKIGISKHYVYINYRQNKIELHVHLLSKIEKSVIPVLFKVGIVEEYPTEDRLTINYTPLNFKSKESYNSSKGR